MNEFKQIGQCIIDLIEAWEPKLIKLPVEVITNRRNSQNRTIKQILGHMVDSASNNTHRVVHLQYQQSPLEFPNYATNGNNDRWIAIQNYQEEDWAQLVNFWKYSNLHYVHIILNIRSEALENKWIAAPGKLISLKEMVTDFLRHFELHLSEIETLINSNN